MNLIKTIKSPNFNSKRLQIEFSKILINRGIIKGQDKYQKFIILGRSRVGSNLLISYLNSHPSVYAHGELFGNTTPSGLVEFRWNKPEEYLYKYGYRNYSSRIKAVGFKIFYYHPVKGEPKKIWDILKNIDGLKVIHLKRRNILSTHVSKEIAGKTDKWTTTGNTVPVNERTICLSPEDCLKAFEETRQWENHFNDFFNNNNGGRNYDVYYEDLITNTDDELKKILHFLNQDEYELKTSLKKQNPEPLNKLISNYDELKNHFQGTQWSRFFED